MIYDFFEINDIHTMCDSIPNSSFRIPHSELRIKSPMVLGKIRQGAPHITGEGVPLVHQGRNAGATQYNEA